MKTERNINDAETQQGLLVKLELKEATDRMRAEGIGFHAIIAGIASLANEVITTEYSQVTASAWFLGLAKNAANLAADEFKGKAN